MLIVHAPQPLAQHVCIDLRRRDVRVPEHHLHAAKIGAPVKQVSRKTMADNVRGQILEDTGPQTVLLEQFPGTRRSLSPLPRVLNIPIEAFKWFNWTPTNSETRSPVA